jgi:fibulin 1/2
VGCVNTLGSYRCIDLKDQVSGNHSQSTESEDTISSVSVECSSGFKLGTSGSCIDIDECAMNNGGCSHTCQNTLGGANCLCPPGFMLGNDWKTCKGA